MYKRFLTIFLAIIAIFILTTCDLNLPDLNGTEETPGKVVETYDGLLGSGYDIINGRFYNSEDLKSVLLDTDKMAADGLIIVDSRNQRLTRIDYIAGETLESYMESAALNVNASASASFFSFKGSISADFGISTSSKAEKSDSFAKTTTTLVKQRDSIRPYNISDIQNKYLCEIFKEEWLMNTNITPKELIQSYGTHVMLMIYYGGRLDMSYIYNNIENKSTMEIEVGLRARYGSVSGSSNTNYSQANEFYQNTSFVFIFISLLPKVVEITRTFFFVFIDISLLSKT